jgi:ubiquinone/menaquinone biosynthesis C-methylase UbiE
MSAERQENSQDNPWWGEHVHRYMAALPYINETDNVLDIACGSGFGSYMLSRKTKGMVTGADISEQIILYCKEKHKTNSNLSFSVVDGTHMQFEDGFFDRIVSFETIEHTTAYKEMLGEFRRTLKAGGTAIISTPNILVNSPTGVVLNPYHTQEFSYEELLVLLKGFFDDVHIWGQQYTRYQKRSARNALGQLAEKTLYRRGIRKVPLNVQNSIMRSITGKNMYPSENDYELTDKKDEILKCKTFFVLCRKK